MAIVTIGIPFYNAERYLADAIRSVINQSYSDWFLVLLNDGSTDNSLAIARSFECNRIRVISDGVNRGLVFRLNQLSQLSTSLYYARMDADDVMHRDRLSIQVSYLEDHPDVDVVGTGVYYINDINQVYGKGYAVSAAQTKKDALYGKNFYHPTIMGRTDWFRHNPYDEKALRMEDYELWVRTVEDSKFANIDMPLYFYREAGLPYLDKYLLSQKGIRDILRKELNGLEKHWMLLRNYSKCVIFSVITYLKLQKYFLRHKHPVLTEKECKIADFFLKESVASIQL